MLGQHTVDCESSSSNHPFIVDDILEIANPYDADIVPGSFTLEVQVLETYLPDLLEDASVSEGILGHSHWPSDHFLKNDFSGSWDSFLKNDGESSRYDMDRVPPSLISFKIDLPSPVDLGTVFEPTNLGISPTIGSTGDTVDSVRANRVSAVIDTLKNIDIADIDIPKPLGATQDSAIAVNPYLP